MKHILCFGDSNLFGTNPSGGRWPLEQRWTGLLAQALGDGYRIIEEGLGGRTTVFDDPLEENRCGLKQLPIMLHSHRPLDLVILSLGTNDCKVMFNANAKIIAKALEKLALLIQNYPYGEGYPTPQVLVVAPIQIAEGVENSSFASFDNQSYLLSKQLGPAIREMARRNNLLFLDASLVAKSSPIDFLHMDREGHSALAAALLPLVLDLFDDERALVTPEEELLGSLDDDGIQEGSAEEAIQQEREIQDKPSDTSDTLSTKRKERSPSHRRGRLPFALSFFKRRF